MKVEIYGLEKTHKMLMDLPLNVLKGADKGEGEFIKFVQKAAKLRAPRLTGALAQSIEFRQNRVGNWTLFVDSPYGWFQEHGFEPHLIFPSMPTRAGVGGPFISDIYGNFGAGIAKKNTPFIEPAFDAGMLRLPSMLQDAIYKSIKGSAK